MELVVHDDPAAVAAASSRRISELLAGPEPRFTLGLAGGTTPEATYRAVDGAGPGWDRVVTWLSDERWVAPDDQRSNGAMVMRSLLDHVPARLARPMWSETLQPEDSAAHYEATIRSIHGDDRPDLILLGIGTDGHTASLFPGTAALDEAKRWFVANDVAQLGEIRLTATFPFLWRARRLMVLAVGSEKAEAIEESFAGKTPAGRLGDGDAEVEWHVDSAAASRLA